MAEYLFFFHNSNFRQQYKKVSSLYSEAILEFFPWFDKVNWSLAYVGAHVQVSQLINENVYNLNIMISPPKAIP